MPDRMILEDDAARLVISGEAGVLYDCALGYAAVAHALGDGEVIRFSYSAPTGAPEECQGHHDAISGEGLDGEPVYCDGSCLPPAYVTRYARVLIEQLAGPDEEPPARPMVTREHGFLVWRAPRD